METENPEPMRSSRFYMWRAVFAMAHADGIVTHEEREFVENYLQRLPLSPEQVATLRADLEQPQSVGEMFIGISKQEDQADFFQFAHMLVWADGDFEAQEEAILSRFRNEQMNKFNIAEVSMQIRQAREAAAVRRAIEDAEFKRQAKEVVGVQNVFRALVPWMEHKGFEAPDENTFNLWRAIFGLAHVDCQLDEAERGYINGMMEVFHFSEEQRAVIADDMDLNKDIDRLFRALPDPETRKQFFALARTMVWADGAFHDKERIAIQKLKDLLKPEELEGYGQELEWLEEKPEMPSQEELSTANPEIMRQIFRGMEGFYNRNAA